MPIIETAGDVSLHRSQFLEATYMNGERFRSNPDYQKRISDRVHDYIVKKIFEGHWKQGMSITETGIREELNVSGAPVRESMMRLNYEGWVEMRPHRGTKVSDFSDKTKLQNLAVLRMSLELGPACVLAASITPTQIAELKDILKDVDDAVSKDDRDGYVMADIRLHQTIAHWGGGDRIGQQFDTVLLQTFVTRPHTGPMELSNNNHHDLLEAILAKDVGRVAEVLHSHIMEPLK